jgi:MSHA biogenesis protein MshJ
MRRLWITAAGRLERLAQRERLAVFAAAALAILALVFVAGIEPALEQRKLLAARVADQERLLAAARNQQRELAQTLSQDPEAGVRARMAEKRQQIAAIDGQLAGLQRTLVSPERMPSVLREMVGKEQGIRLLSLRNLPAAPLLAAEQGGDAPGSEHPGPGRHVYRHGVEIVVQGSYLDLLSYVSRLERQSWQVYWGKTVLTAEYPKTVVALTLYTLSLDKAWLVV